MLSPHVMHAERRSISGPFLKGCFYHGLALITVHHVAPLAPPRSWVEEKGHLRCEVCGQQYKGEYVAPPPPPPGSEAASRQPMQPMFILDPVAAMRLATARQQLQVMERDLEAEDYQQRCEGGDIEAGSTVNDEDSDQTCRSIGHCFATRLPIDPSQAPRHLLRVHDLRLHPLCRRHAPHRCRGRRRRRRRLGRDA